jgi:hypothetical protein
MEEPDAAFDRREAALLADAIPEQKISSRQTSVNTVPALFKSRAFMAARTGRNLDFGGGRFSTASQWLRAIGTANFVYDPYNRTGEHNRRVLAEFSVRPAETVTVCNVLCVIAEPAARSALIGAVHGLLARDGTAFFSAYEGDRSGIGRATPRGWQNNLPCRGYIAEIAAVFPFVKSSGGVISARKTDW